jgi:hypothetical protein
MGRPSVNLQFADQKSAQDRADKLHLDMISSNSLYAESAALYDSKNPEKGGTARWCFAYQDLDPVTKVQKDAFWRVTVDERVIPVLTAQEDTAIGIVIEAIPIQEELLP